ncbi:hypothetical protein NQD34_013380, partial [Periophthalmus magnuspinnatus]
SSLPVQAPPYLGSAACFLYNISFTVLLSFSVTNIIILLPLCLSIWFLGLRCRCWQKSNTHLDVFTYHMVTMEMVGVSACAVFIYSFIQNALKMMFKALEVYSYTTYGQLYFHILTCVDRYIAVVHPITYLRLKERGGARLRNILISFVWFLFVLKFFLNADYDNAIQIFFLVFSIVVVTFCNFAVLYVLIRPPPGERVQVSQSKMRAFKTIVVILLALVIRIVMHLSVVGFYTSNLLTHKKRCAVLISGVFFGLPSSVV